jgi:hypothetical protein
MIPSMSSKPAATDIAGTTSPAPWPPALTRRAFATTRNRRSLTADGLTTTDACGAMPRMPSRTADSAPVWSQLLGLSRAPKDDTAEPG